MSIHGDDVVIEIRRALEKTLGDTFTEVSSTPIKDGRGWPQRDGKHQFDFIPRDWMRAFRITVEAININAVDSDFVPAEQWGEEA